MVLGCMCFTLREGFGFHGVTAAIRSLKCLNIQHKHSLAHYSFSSAGAVSSYRSLMQDKDMLV